MMPPAAVFHVPEAVVADTDVLAGMVYGIVHHCCEAENGICKIPVSTIGERLGIGERTARRKLQLLVERRWLARRAGRGTSSEYALAPRMTPVTMTEVPSEAPKSGQSDRGTPVRVAEVPRSEMPGFQSDPGQSGLVLKEDINTRDINHPKGDDAPPLDEDDLVLPPAQAPTPANYRKALEAVYGQRLLEKANRAGAADCLALGLSVEEVAKTWRWLVACDPEFWRLQTPNLATIAKKAPAARAAGFRVRRKRPAAPSGGSDLDKELYGG